MATPLQPILTITAGTQVLRILTQTVSETRQRLTETIMDKASGHHQVTQTPLATPQHNRIATVPIQVFGHGSLLFHFTIKETTRASFIVII